MNNKLANFGYVEFEDIKGVFACLRCVHDLQLLDKKLVIRAKDEVADYHTKWKSSKYQEYTLKHLEKGKLLF